MPKMKPTRSLKIFLIVTLIIFLLNFTELSFRYLGTTSLVNIASIISIISKFISPIYFIYCIIVIAQFASQKLDKITLVLPAVFFFTTIFLIVIGFYYSFQNLPKPTWLPIFDFIFTVFNISLASYLLYKYKS